MGLPLVFLVSVAMLLGTRIVHLSEGGDALGFLKSAASGVQLWAIGRLNVPLSPHERSTVLKFCKSFYPSGSLINSSLKATTHASTPSYPPLPLSLIHI